jgi:FAD/FMN-containing dehydrogenase
MANIWMRNWKGSIASRPAAVVAPRSEDEIAAIVRDPLRYPSPLRAVGSQHSTTRCTVAEDGTVLDTRHLDRILSDLKMLFVHKSDAPDTGDTDSEQG